MSKYKNKYRIESTRYKDWNYSEPWWYFVTIKTKLHNNFFGQIINEKMKFNSVGLIADKYWNEIPLHFKNIELDEYVIMPNHIHGIIIINPSPKSQRRDVACNVSTEVNSSIIISENLKMSLISPKKGTLSVVIRSYKSAVTKYVRQNLTDLFAWQKSFHDRIIRNNYELAAIRQYMLENPELRFWENTD